MRERIYITDPDKLERVVAKNLEEQEISICKCRDESMYSVFISDNKMLTKFKRLMNTAPDDYIKCWEGSRNSRGELTGYFFEINPRCISFRAGKSKSRNLTAEQKAQKRATFIESTRKARENKKNLK